MNKILITIGIVALSLFFVGTVHATQITQWDGDTLTPTEEVTPIEEVTPTEVVTPTETVESNNPSSDGRSDGLGCATHDCNTNVVVPEQAPDAGRG